MSWVLGIDTSNYTTSVAAWNLETKEMIQSKKKLPVKEGALGLRQSDAVFAHVNQLGDLIKEVVGQVGKLVAVGVSVRPRDQKGSYMPCFLTGRVVAISIGSALKIPVFEYSHQAGHIAAALFSTKALPLLTEPFIAFHLSGGTTECVTVTPGKENISEFTSEILYDSKDLYAGQAVDRVGAMLGLPFPAGPALEQLALQSDKDYSKSGPRPYFDEQGNPSLSGLENQCKQRLEHGESKEDVARYCLSFLSRVLQQMTANALNRHPNYPVLYAGGVMSNSILQQEIAAAFPSNTYFATPAFSADNAAGVAVLAGLQHKIKRGETVF